MERARTSGGTTRPSSESTAKVARPNHVESWMTGEDEVCLTRGFDGTR